MRADRMRRAVFHALSAADTLRMRGVLRHVDIHLANSGALPAADAFLLIHTVAEKRDPVKKSVESAEWAEPFAEGAVEKDAEDHDRRQDAGFPGKERTERRPYPMICDRKWDPPFQNPLGADVLAEVRRSDTRLVRQENREGDHRNRKNRVFQIAQRFQLFRTEFSAGDFMQQILKPPEGAEEAADKSPEHNPQKNEDAADVIGKIKLRGSHNRLKGSYRAGSRCCRTGIAIEAGHADLFDLPVIQHPLQEIGEMYIGQKGRESLNRIPLFQKGLRRKLPAFFLVNLIQCRHTPNINEWPS